MPKKGQVKTVGQSPLSPDEKEFAGSAVEGFKSSVVPPPASEVVRGEDVLARMKRGGRP